MCASHFSYSLLQAQTRLWLKKDVSSSDSGKDDSNSHTNYGTQEQFVKTPFGLERLAIDGLEEVFDDDEEDCVPLPKKSKQAEDEDWCTKVLEFSPESESVLINDECNLYQEPEEEYVETISIAAKCLKVSKRELLIKRIRFNVCSWEFTHLVKDKKKKKTGLPLGILFEFRQNDQVIHKEFYFGKRIIS